MQQGRRALLGLALLGGMSRVLHTNAQTIAPGARPVPAPAPSALPRLDAELDAIAANPACELASLSVVAVRNGKVVYEHQAGRRHYDGAGGPPVTRDTMFRIASISKMVTTLGLMRLVEDGKVALDTDVSLYLGFPLKNPHFPARPVTLRTLLTHTSSLRDAAGYSWPNERALKDILVPGGIYYGKGEMWADRAAPGDYFTYCNLNWSVIGTIMERVTGERFDRLQRRLVLDPLGIHGGYNPSEFSAEERANLATLYRKRAGDDDAPWNPQGPWIPQVDDYTAKPPQPPAGIEKYAIGTNASPFSPTGGLRISAPDMAKIMIMLINQGRHEGKQLWKPETLARMYTRQWTYDGKGGNGDSNDGLFYAWGMGNQQFFDQNGRTVVEGGGYSAVGHLGDAYGLMSVFMVDRATGNGMIALVGGTSTDPEKYKGQYSSMARFQEQILSAMYQRAILGKNTQSNAT